MYYVLQDNDFLPICTEKYKARGLKYIPSLQGALPKGFEFHPYRLHTSPLLVPSYLAIDIIVKQVFNIFNLNKNH